MQGLLPCYFEWNARSFKRERSPLKRRRKRIYFLPIGFVRCTNHRWTSRWRRPFSGPLCHTLYLGNGNLLGTWILLPTSTIEARNIFSFERSLELKLSGEKRFFHKDGFPLNSENIFVKKLRSRIRVQDHKILLYLVRFWLKVAPGFLKIHFAHTVTAIA